MMIYLTGASTSLAKSPEAPQNDTAKSLGGYVSSTPVPNAEVNALFDLISAYTLEKKKKETIGLGLINRLDKPVTDVKLKIVVGSDNIASFKVAAVALDSQMAMEHIPNRYSEPIAAKFYKADFERAYVDLRVDRPANAGDQIEIQPIGLTIDVEEGGMEGTFDAFVAAFEDDDKREVIRVSDNVFRIARTDEKVIEGIEYSYVTEGAFVGQFLGEMKNHKTGEVVLIDDEEQLAPEKGIGLWIQRDINKYRYPTNEQLIKEYKEHLEKSDLETAELVISYNVVDNHNYDPEDYDDEDYS